jgi:hypothetical protein
MSKAREFTPKILLGFVTVLSSVLYTFLEFSGILSQLLIFLCPFADPSAGPSGINQNEQ